VEPVSIDKTSAGMRLDVFLAGKLAEAEPERGLSRAEIQRFISEGLIKLNGALVKSSVRIKVNDRIEFQAFPLRSSSIEAQALPLEIIYEDTDCLVINKAAGMIVHPAAGQAQGTLVNALLHHCKDLAGVGGERRPGIVHRLDKDTSGVMIVAKNPLAYRQLVSQFRNRQVHKEYLALTRGKIAPTEGRIERPIGRHRSDRKRMSSLYSLDKARPALTEWRVLEYFVGESNESHEAVTLVRLLPRTGRTHQLRVHLADLGYPIVGDKVYGRRRHMAEPKSLEGRLLAEFPRQALHAEILAFQHARTGRLMEFRAPMAKDMEILVNRLRRAHGGKGIPEKEVTKGVDKVTFLK
jgi:23S rRNA pseudouridine1911/1915/1917 synthase